MNLKSAFYYLNIFIASAMPPLVNKDQTDLKAVLKLGLFSWTRLRFYVVTGSHIILLTTRRGVVSTQSAMGYRVTLERPMEKD